jgi:hypothetical protein
MLLLAAIFLCRGSLATTNPRGSFSSRRVVLTNELQSTQSIHQFIALLRGGGGEESSPPKKKKKKKKNTSKAKAVLNDAMKEKDTADALGDAIR